MADRDHPHAPALSLRLEAARALGCTTACLDPSTGYLWRIERGDTARLLYGGLSPLNDALAAAIATDKLHAATVLREAGFHTPGAARCLRPGRFSDNAFADHTGIGAGCALAEEVGFPLIVKPAHGARGRSVTSVADQDALEAAVERVWRDDYLALVEPVVPGLDLRVDLLDGFCLIAYLRRPLTFVADGRRTLRELIEAAGGDPAATITDPGWAPTALGRVPAAGSTIGFRGPVLNLNGLATASVIALPLAWLTHSRSVAIALRLRHCGIDFKVSAMTSDPTTSVVIEVNASPSLEQIARRGHRDVALAGEMRVVEAILASG